MTPTESSEVRSMCGRMLAGKWRLDSLLGSGGMSEVYLGTHRNGNQVAIKILRGSHLGHSRARERFLREGYIANRVEHQGVAKVLDDGEHEGSVFLVMELLHGEDTEALRRRHGGRLSPQETTWLARHALEILAAAHRASVVHRDLKPHNLFLTFDGQVKLLDFGIASLRDAPEFATLTEASVLPGTPGFMAPEQVRGHTDRVGPWTDTWGLGATMFRLVTGEAVHPGSTAGEMLVATATCEPRSVADVCPELPSGFVHAVDKALRMDPEQRWPSAEAMLDGLRDEETLAPYSVQDFAQDAPDLERTLETLPHEVGGQSASDKSEESGVRVGLSSFLRSPNSSKVWGLGLTTAIVLGALGVVAWSLGGRSVMAYEARDGAEEYALESPPETVLLPGGAQEERKAPAVSGKGREMDIGEQLGTTQDLEASARLVATTAKRISRSLPNREATIAIPRKNRQHAHESLRSESKQKARGTSEPTDRADSPKRDLLKRRF